MHLKWRLEGGTLSSECKSKKTRNNDGGELLCYVGPDTTVDNEAKRMNIRIAGALRNFLNCCLPAYYREDASDLDLHPLDHRYPMSHYSFVQCVLQTMVLTSQGLDVDHRLRRRRCLAWYRTMYSTGTRHGTRGWYRPNVHTSKTTHSFSSSYCTRTCGWGLFVRFSLLFQIPTAFLRKYLAVRPRLTQKAQTHFENCYYY
jgi:hypothetical protein